MKVKLYSKLYQYGEQLFQRLIPLNISDQKCFLLIWYDIIRNYLQLKKPQHIDNWTGKILCSSKPWFYFPPCCLSLLANHEIVIYLYIYMGINCPFVSLKLEWLLLSLSLKNTHDFSYITSYDLSITLASYRVRLFLHKPTQTLAKKISIKVV